MSETSKDAVMQSMFGVFNKPASETKFKKEDDASGGVMFKPDPKNSPNQVFRGVVKFLPNLHDMENMTVTKTTYWVPEGAQGGFTYDSPKSIGKYEKCIVADKYWELSGSDDARLKALAKKINYSKKTYALVQVVKDLGKPENDGTWCRVECEKWINTIPNNFHNFYVPKDYGFYYIPIDTI